MSETPLPAYVARLNAEAAPVIIGHLGKGIVTECSGCKAEHIVKVRKGRIMTWECRCGTYNHTERKA